MNISILCFLHVVIDVVVLRQKKQQQQNLVIFFLACLLKTIDSTTTTIEQQQQQQQLGKKMSFLALDSSCSWQVSFFSDLIFFLTKNPNLFVNILYVCVYWICYWSYGLNKKKSSSSSFDDLMKWIWKTLAH